MTALAVVDEGPGGTLQQIVPASGWWVVVTWRSKTTITYHRYRVAAWAVTDTGVEAMVAGDGARLVLASDEYADDDLLLQSDDDIIVCDCGRRRGASDEDPKWCHDCGGVIREDW